MCVCVCVWWCVALGIINQLGPDNLEILKKIAGSYQGGAGDGVGIIIITTTTTTMKGFKYMPCAYI